MALLNSRIDTVTLYQSGATVRRVAEVDCEQGRLPAEVELAGLPLSLVETNVRVRVVGTTPDAVAVVAGAVRLGLHVPPPGTPPEAPAEAELRKARQALELKEDAIATLEAEIALIAGIPVPERPDGEDGKQPPPSPMHARLTLDQLADEGITARLEQVRTLREQAKAAREAVDDLVRRRALVSSSQTARRDALTRSVTVRLVAPAGTACQRLTLEVEYFVRAARWSPAYQCRMTRDCSRADLQLRAMVWQRSGEDWSRAKLALSTAAPLRWTELPELMALRIGKRQPPPPAKAGFRPPPTGSEPLFADADAAREQSRAALPVIPSWHAPALADLPSLPSLPAPSFGGRASYAESGAPPPDAPAEFEAMDDEAPSTPPAAMKELARRGGPTGGPPGAGGRPPPPPPAPAPMAAAMAMESRAMPPRMVPAPAAAPARAVLAKKAKRDSRMEEETSERLMAADMDLADGAMLGGEGEANFLWLELGAPTEPGRRTKLHLVDRRRAALEALARSGARFDFDPLTDLDRALAAGFDEPPSLANRTELAGLTGNFDFVYRTETPVDVPSDGSWHSVPVNQRTADASVLYVAVPREDSHVYREAMVKNPLPSPMLSGPVDVYVADDYVLSTTLPTVGPGGEFKLGLGVEQAIKVARNTRFNEVRSGEKVVAMQDLVHDIEIELVNRLEREIRCEVRERIPQPAPEAEVVVEEVEVKPAWAPYHQGERGQPIEGGRKWSLNVGAGKTQKLAARYLVKLYANNELVGGNRREA